MLGRVRGPARDSGWLRQVARNDLCEGGAEEDRECVVVCCGKSASGEFDDAEAEEEQVLADLRMLWSMQLQEAVTGLGETERVEVKTLPDWRETKKVMMPRRG